VTTIPELVDQLLRAEPALDAVLREHIADNHELLSHLYMADVTRWLVANGPAAPVLAVLEAALIDGDPDVRDVLLGSFVENIEQDDPAYWPLRWALGPALRAALDEQESWPLRDLEPPT
jgi:hypothetical protein